MDQGSGARSLRFDAKSIATRTPTLLLSKAARPPTSRAVQTGISRKDSAGRAGFLYPERKAPDQAAGGEPCG
jgi:hypothetical protein